MECDFGDQSGVCSLLEIPALTVLSPEVPLPLAIIALSRCDFLEAITPSTGLGSESSSVELGVVGTCK